MKNLAAKIYTHSVRVGFNGLLHKEDIDILPNFVHGDKLEQRSCGDKTIISTYSSIILFSHML